ncbi:MAG: hypothetical protein ACKPBA_11715 [Planctomycetota bacterium]
MTPVQVLRASSTSTHVPSSPHSLTGMAATSATHAHVASWMREMNATLSRPLLTRLQRKLVRLAKFGAALTSATAKSSAAGETPGTPAQAFFTMTDIVPPSIAPSMIGRKAHETSSRA